MKNFIIVTGGAGFVGYNLIKSLLKKTKYKIISLDNYSSGDAIDVQITRIDEDSMKVFLKLP